MSDSEDVAAIIIAVVGSQQVRCRRRPRSFWVRPSLVGGRKKYSRPTEEFMKDLLLIDVDDLNLEYRCDVGFQNFFRMNNSDLENILMHCNLFKIYCAPPKLGITRT